MSKWSLFSKKCRKLSDFLSFWPCYEWRTFLNVLKFNSFALIPINIKNNDFLGDFLHWFLNCLKFWGKFLEIICRKTVDKKYSETSRKWLTVAIFRKWQTAVWHYGLTGGHDWHGWGGGHDWHGWLAWITGMDDWHWWLAQMTGIDYWHRWLAQMTGTDD